MLQLELEIAYVLLLETAKCCGEAAGLRAACALRSTCAHASCRHRYVEECVWHVDVLSPSSHGVVDTAFDARQWRLLGWVRTSRSFGTAKTRAKRCAGFSAALLRTLLVAQAL